MDKPDLHTMRNLLAALAIAGLSAYSHATLAADPPAADAKPVAAKPSGVQPAAPAKPASIKGAMADVGDISVEVRKLEKHIAGIEQSVGEINASLKHMEGIDKTLVTVEGSLAPVGALTRPEGLTALINQVSDVAFSRGIVLILLASGCAALLLVLLAFLLRWSLRPVPKEPK